MSTPAAKFAAMQTDEADSGEAEAKSAQDDLVSLQDLVDAWPNLKPIQKHLSPTVKILQDRLYTLALLKQADRATLVALNLPGPLIDAVCAKTATETRPCDDCGQPVAVTHLKAHAEACLGTWRTERTMDRIVSLIVAKYKTERGVRNWRNRMFLLHHGD